MQALDVSAPPRVHPLQTQEWLDFFHIFRIIWRRKVSVISVASIAVVLAAAYAYLATPEYEVSTVLRPAALNDLDSLNRSEVYLLPPSKALNRMGATLGSYDTRFSYFRAKPELVEAYTLPGETLEQAFSNFNMAFKLVLPDSKKEDLLTNYIGLKMRYKEGVDGAAILNEFVLYAAEIERAEISKDLKVIVGNRLEEVDAKLRSAAIEYDAKKESVIAKLIEEDSIMRAELQDELSALRVQLKMRREARLVQLGEAISIARSLGLKKPATPSSMAEEVVVASSVIRTEFNNQQVPLYFMGSEVLEAERSVLRRRVSDDFTEPRVSQIRKELLMLASNRKVEIIKTRKNEKLFLEGVESLRVERARLSNINTDLRQIRLVVVDQLAVPPMNSSGPAKALIILTALIGGVILGAGVALVRELFKVRLRQVRRFELENDVSHVKSSVSFRG